MASDSIRLLWVVTTLLVVPAYPATLTVGGVAFPLPAAGGPFAGTSANGYLFDGTVATNAAVLEAV
jgi:hypothetical protein